jgi:hypothetical protein
LNGRVFACLFAVLLANVPKTVQTEELRQPHWESDQKAVTWHWQSWQNSSGTVDWRGITTDLDAMHEAGISWARIHIGPEMDADLVNHLLDLSSFRNVHFLVLVADTGAIANRESPDWLASMVSKYKGRLTVWEIGNEENDSAFWGVQGGRKASVQSYVDYLRLAYGAMKEADPNATILMGGLMGYNVEEFLPLFLRLGGGQYTDGFNIHPYAATPDGVIERLSTIEREISVDPHLRGKPVWITEIGFYANEPKWNNAGRVPDESTKASYLRKTIQKLRKHGISTPIFWYNFHDSQPGVCGYSLVLYDLSDHDEALKAYRAYQELEPLGSSKDEGNLSSVHSSRCR